MLDFENKYYKENYKYIVGVDEAGRGCLLGPVFAGAVIFPKDYKSELINDSKKLTEKQREKAFLEIKEHAIAYGIGYCTPEEIDKINILNASRLAMERAIENMHHEFDLVLSDCMKFQNFECPVVDLVKGDAKALCIAAASILAKVSRDHACYELDKQYPKYHIAKHKGYGTKEHIELLNEYGPIKGLYRYSYKPVQEADKEKITLF